ncbi:NADPH-dependent F420 reductase [Rhodococcus sp. NPDC127528]|uniref:NADPH-dependent F420 reductase n=1 Tax=unclassified Rhodococcus (in: high G+C Gram-positive bacteria) TaxID=192944 RepID=UPI0036421F88
MRITVIGRGHVGGGLARRWEAAGHEVTAIGRGGGDATGAEVVVVAIPGDAIVAGLDAVVGLDGQVTIDATNTFGARPQGYDSVAQQVKAIVGGPTAKAFNTNFASVYDAVDAEPVPPGTLFASDADARQATERLIRDAGFDPIHLGDLSTAPVLESLVALTSTLDRGDLGPFFTASIARGNCPRGEASTRPSGRAAPASRPAASSSSRSSSLARHVCPPSTPDHLSEKRLADMAAMT